MGKIGEHGRVVGRVAAKNNLITNRFHVLFKNLLEKQPGHGQLVVVTEPPVDVDGTDLGGGAGRLEDRLDGLDRFQGQGRHVLAEVDGQVRLPIGLIGGDGATGNLGQHRCPDTIEPGPIGTSFFS
jgi:hypothetical protein